VAGRHFGSYFHHCRCPCPAHRCQSTACVPTRITASVITPASVFVVGSQLVARHCRGGPYGAFAVAFSRVNRSAFHHIDETAPNTLARTPWAT